MLRHIPLAVAVRFSFHDAVAVAVVGVGGCYRLDRPWLRWVERKTHTTTLFFSVVAHAIDKGLVVHVNPALSVGRGKGEAEA